MLNTQAKCLFFYESTYVQNICFKQILIEMWYSLWSKIIKRPRIRLLETLEMRILYTKTLMNFNI